MLSLTRRQDKGSSSCNDFAVKALQAGLHECAVSGIVHVYELGSGESCFACYRDAILSEGRKRNWNIAYSDASDVLDLTIQPGLLRR